MSEPIKELIAFFGSQSATAKALDVSQATVSYWLSGSQKISVEKALAAQVQTAGAILASDLNPVVAEVVALQTLNKSCANRDQLASNPDGAVIPSSGAQQ